MQTAAHKSDVLSLTALHKPETAQFGVNRALFTPVTTVTATRLTLSYLLLIGTGQRPHPRGARAMTKFYSLMLALMLMAPVAFATMNQAAQMVA